MNIKLIKFVRKSEVRIRDSIEKHRKNSNRPLLLHVLISQFRIWIPLSEIPVQVPRSARFYLLSAPRPNSKTAEVINELRAAGWPDSTFFYPQKRRLWVVCYLLRFVARLPKSIVYYLVLKRKAPHLDAVGQSILMRRELYRKLLNRHPQLHPVIISDVSPELHIIWSASFECGNRAVWWQTDYHNKGPLAFPVHAAAILNQGGYNAVRELCPDVNIAQRPSVDLKPMRPVPDAPIVGVASSVTFCGNQQQKRLIKNLLEAVGGISARVRLHPNSKVDPKMIEGTWFSVAPEDENIEEFAQSIDLAVVGNSAVQLKLLFEGVPVLLVDGLDENNFDRYGYMKNGFVLGALDITEINKAEINKFYASDRRDQYFLDYVFVNNCSSVVTLSCILLSSCQRGSHLSGYSKLIVHSDP